MLNNAICEYLKGIGHMVESFTDGEEVTNSVDNSFDLLILDINVPKKDGFEILQELNERRLYIPTIFITALNDIEDITKAYDLGCREYLKKPFHLEELGIKINQILKKDQKSTSHVRFSENYSYSKEKKNLILQRRTSTFNKKTA